MKKSLSVFALVFAGGCTGTLDSVPLIYVSSHKIGVNVSAGTPDTPGAEFSIGSDLTDAAFVPVAVARSCSTGTRAEDCDAADHPIQIVSGTAMSDLARQRTNLQERRARIRRNLKDAEATDRAVLQSELNEISQRLESLNASAEEAELSANASGRGRADALSVFGSFNNSTGATIDPDAEVEVSFGLGKTFATGVAAQQLTDGMGSAIRANAVADCLTQAHTLIGTAQGPEADAARLGIARACGITTSANSNNANNGSGEGGGNGGGVGDGEAGGEGGETTTPPDGADPVTPPAGDGGQAGDEKPEGDGAGDPPPAA